MAKIWQKLKSILVQKTKTKSKTADKNNTALNSVSVCHRITLALLEKTRGWVSNYVGAVMLLISVCRFGKRTLKWGRSWRGLTLRFLSSQVDEVTFTLEPERFSLTPSPLRDEGSSTRGSSPGLPAQIPESDRIPLDVTSCVVQLLEKDEEAEDGSIVVVATNWIIRPEKRKKKTAKNWK